MTPESEWQVEFVKLTVEAALLAIQVNDSNNIGTKNRVDLATLISGAMLGVAIAVSQMGANERAAIARTTAGHRRLMAQLCEEMGK